MQSGSLLEKEILASGGRIEEGGSGQMNEKELQAVDVLHFHKTSIRNTSGALRSHIHSGKLRKF